MLVRTARTRTAGMPHAAGVIDPLALELPDAPAWAPERGLLRGTDRYAIVEQIGEGTYGKVFLGVDRVTGRKVALKRMTPHHEGEGFPRTETREIKTLKSIQHPAMVALIEVVTSLGTDVDGVSAAPAEQQQPAGSGAGGGQGAVVLNDQQALGAPEQKAQALGQSERSGNIFMVFDYIDYDLAGEQGASTRVSVAARRPCLVRACVRPRV